MEVCGEFRCTSELLLDDDEFAPVADEADWRPGGDDPFGLLIEVNEDGLPRASVLRPFSE